jgi:hypothetical protein
MALADLVEARHLMAQSDAESQKRLATILRQLDEAFPPLMKRYAELWLRVSKPKGLEPNLGNFQKVLDSVREQLKKQ